MLWLPYQAYTLLIRPRHLAATPDRCGAPPPLHCMLSHPAGRAEACLANRAQRAALHDWTGRHGGPLDWGAPHALTCLLLSLRRSPLGDAALLLLLVLVFHAPPLDAPYGNPFRTSLQRLQDADALGALGGRAGGLLASHKHRHRTYWPSTAAASGVVEDALRQLWPQPICAWPKAHATA